MTEPGSPTALQTPTAASPAGFRIVRVLAIVLPVALVLGGIVVYFAFFEGQLANFGSPPLVPVTGTITYKGEPLVGAAIYSKPDATGLTGAWSYTDQQGRFVLKTDVNGTFVDGAYAGKHKFTVKKEGQGRGASAPPLLTPQIYYTFDTSPIAFELKRPPAKNELEIKLEGEPPTRANTGDAPPPTRAGGQGQDDSDGSAAQEESSTPNERTRPQAEPSVPAPEDPNSK